MGKKKTNKLLNSRLFSQNSQGEVEIKYRKIAIWALVHLAVYIFLSGQNCTRAVLKWVSKVGATFLAT